MENTKLGKIIADNDNAERDAIHIAVNSLIKNMVINIVTKLDGLAVVNF